MADEMIVADTPVEGKGASLMQPAYSVIAVLSVQGVIAVVRKNRIIASTGFGDIIPESI
jgi:hypothetical protein